MFRLLRRFTGPVGLMTIGRVAWAHRGSMVRLADLVRHVPEHARQRDAGPLVTEARAVLALDEVAPTDTSLRITGLDDGQLTLRGDDPAGAPPQVREALLRVPKVVDVRTDELGRPGVAETLANVRV